MKTKHLRTKLTVKKATYNFINFKNFKLMKKIYLSIITIFTICSFSFGQNVHIEYSSASFNFLSSTTLVNSNNYYTYMVATNDNNQLIVAELNTYPYMEPIYSNSVAFQMSDTVFIKGGFFDVDDNIVVYGYVNPNKNGIIIKINMNNGSPASINYIQHPNNYTEITDGCWSECEIGNNVFKAYDFIYSGSIFMRIENDLSTRLANRRFGNWNIRSVSWDNINKKHIISGNTSSGTANCKNFIGYLNNNVALSPLNFYELALPSDDMFSEGTHRHILSDENGVAYLCQDYRFRENGMGDGLWISKVNYMTGQLEYSSVYRFGLEKVWILDATKTYDYMFVLGHHNGADSTTISGTFERRFVAQFNLYDNTDYAVKLMADNNLTYPQFPSPPFPMYDLINTTYLNNITYNPGMETVFSSGAAMDKSYVVETYDLNYDEDCDINQDVVKYDIIPSISGLTAVLQNVTSWGNIIVNTITNSTPVSFSEDVICPDYYTMAYYQEQRLVELQSRNLEKSLKNGTEETPLNVTSDMLIQKAQIEVVDNYQFVCKNFEGDCYFKIYDITGRLLSEGVTQNYNINSVLIDNPGMYIISARDSNNRTAKTKIIISE